MTTIGKTRAERTRLYEQAQEVFKKEAPWVTLAHAQVYRAMAKGVAEALDAILAPLHLSVAQLKAKERYAEDVF